MPPQERPLRLRDPSAGRLRARHPLGQVWPACATWRTNHPVLESTPARLLVPAAGASPRVTDRLTGAAPVAEDRGFSSIGVA